LYTREKRREEYAANMGERRVQVLGSKLDGKKLLVRPRRRWVDNNKMVLKGEGWGRGMNLSASGQEQVMCVCECDKGISGSIKCRELLD
jgi:hypothetical protein